MHLLHVFSTFAPGGPQVRTVTLMNALAGQVRHTVVAMDSRAGAAERVHPDVDLKLLPAPRASGFRMPWAVARIISHSQPDVVCTYNWGAIEAVAGGILSGVPVIHAEDGFGPDEATALNFRRVLTRGVVLRGAYTTVTPSLNLESIALERYQLPRRKVDYIPNGVDCDRFRPGRDIGPRLRLGVADDAVLFGYAGHLRAEKNLPLLLRAFATVQDSGAILALLGGGPCEGELRRLCAELDIEDRVRFVGMVEDPAPYYRAFDVFVMSSDTEQMPLAVLEAMATGLPVVCTDVGDCRILLDTSDPPWVVPARDTAALGAALEAVGGDSEMRGRRGRGNRERCVAEYAEAMMLERYQQLYREAAGRKRRRAEGSA